MLIRVRRERRAARTAGGAKRPTDDAALPRRYRAEVSFLMFDHPEIRRAIGAAASGQRSELSDIEPHLIAAFAEIEKMVLHPAQ